MKIMNNSTPNGLKTNITLGKKDYILNHTSKWLIYRLNLHDLKGLWKKFKDKMDSLQDNNILMPVSEQNLIDYYDENLDIELELMIFDDIMQKHNLFKIKDKMYSYSIGKKTKRTKNIAYVRFYFDLNEFFNY